MRCNQLLTESLTRIKICYLHLPLKTEPSGPGYSVALQTNLHIYLHVFDTHVVSRRNVCFNEILLEMKSTIFDSDF